MAFTFHGKRALVTGAGKGIGRSLAKKLVECGAETYALSRTEADLKSLKEECPSINIVNCDLSDFDKLDSCIKSCGPIDLLVNNAAIAIVEPFLEISAEIFDRHLNVNLKAPLLVSQIIAKGMVDRKSGGSIVNVSSQSSSRAILDHTSYAVTKAALDQMTRNMAQELGPHKIRVNAVNPTVTNTAMAKVGWSDPVKAASMISMIPLGKFAEVDEVVSVILFLLSDQSTMVNGTCLPVDGGALSVMNP